MERTGLFRNRISALFGALLILVLGQVSLAQITVVRTSSDDTLFIGKQENRARGMYVSYSISNGGTDLADVWVQLDVFSGGIVSLAQNGATPLEDGVVHLGDLPAGTSKTAFFYLSATATSSTAQSHQVKVYDRRPDIPGAVLLNDAGGGSGPLFTYAGNVDYDPVHDAIEANPNKIQPETFVVGPNPPVLGGIVTITFQGTTGTIGSDGALLFTPAAFLDWNADALELFETTVVLDEPGCSAGPTCNDGTFVDDLAIEFASGELPSTAATGYTATYRFRAVGTTSAPTAISTIAYITSGNDFKHTATGDLASIAPILPPENRLTLSKTVDRNGLPIEAPGETEIVTYTLTLDNASATDSMVEVFRDTLPAGAIYIGPSLYDGAPIDDPVDDAGTLIWSGSFAAPGSGSGTLSYVVELPTDVPTTHTNSAIAEIGSVQIDSTLATDDDVPASTSVFVPPTPLADLSITKSASTSALPPGGGVLTYTIVVDNAGPSAADSVVLSDTVQADVQNPEFSVDGGGSWLPWTGTLALGTMASGAAQQVLIRGTVGPGFTGTISNTATVSAATSDPTASNNTSEPAVTTVALALRASKTTSTPTLVNTPSGTQATYTVTASNDPGATTAAGVYITDVLPAGFSYDGGTAPTIVLSGGAVRDLVVDPASGATSPSWGSFTIPGGGSVDITFVADVASDVSDGTYHNSVSVSSSTAGVVTSDYDGATGSADDVTVTVPPPSDYGDAPDSYGTLEAGSGARHGIDADLYLGAAPPDEDSDGFGDGLDDTPTGDAADDDLEGSDDEDGVTLFPVLVSSTTSYSIDALVTNTSGSDAHLVGWIDFDRNGLFEADEAASALIAGGTIAQSTTLNWSDIGSSGPDIVAGGSYARFRLTTDPIDGNDPTGAASDGEVEDYPLTIEAAGSLLSGTLFHDDGLGGGSAHDGLQNGGELGISGVVMTVSDGSSSITAVTDPNGDYAVVIPDTFGADVTVSHTLQPATGSSVAGAAPAACLAGSFGDPAAAERLIGDVDCSGAIDGAETGFAGGETYGDHDFGVVRRGIFISDRVGRVASPGTIDYQHLFTPGSEGTVTVQLSGADLDYQLFVDEGCDGGFGPGEGPHAFPHAFTVDAGWPRLGDGSFATCAVRIRVIVADGVPAGHTDTVEIGADLLWSGSPAAVTDTTRVIDTTVVAGGGGLELVKEVCNVSQGCAYGATAQGRPGEILEYRIAFRNLGSDAVTDILFSDPVPFFTSLALDQYGLFGEVELVCPDGTVVEIDTGGVDIVSVDISSACGIGSVAAGESGTVRYRTTID